MDITTNKSGESTQKAVPNIKSLRVLHIGNIANNAYLNAKLLNEAGLDCDVLCHSYYHIMGNPEWEDSDFVGDPGSDFFPNWNKVNLRGFHRPRWFAQGPFYICIRYLTSRREGKFWREKWDWYSLEIARFFVRHPSLTRLLTKIPVLKQSIKSFFFFLARLGFEVIRLTGRVISKVSRLTYKVILKLGRFNFNQAPSLPEAPSPPEAPLAANHFYQYLSSAFLLAFPERLDQILQGDIEPYIGSNAILKALFEHYDVIQAYATDPIFALISGVRPFIAFEHGAIRSIPFEENSQGRLTALSYRMADGVIITNCDNKRAAEKLNLPDYRFIPHPINEKWLLPGIGHSLRESLRNELKADFIIFHPARQHWDAERHPSWEKGNDILIEGMAHVIGEGVARFAAVFVDWGKSVQESKDLLSKLGIADRVKWIRPQNSASMARYIDACDLLADQFYLGAFGSTMPRALALGKPAMIYIDDEIHRWCFSELPPVINARTPDQVYMGLKRAIDEPGWLNALAHDGQTWYQKYHSNAVILEKTTTFYKDILARSPPRQA